MYGLLQYACLQYGFKSYIPLPRPSMWGWHGLQILVGKRTFMLEIAVNMS